MWLKPFNIALLFAICPSLPSGAAALERVRESIILSGRGPGLALTPAAVAAPPCLDLREVEGGVVGPLQRRVSRWFYRDLVVQGAYLMEIRGADGVIMRSAMVPKSFPCDSGDDSLALSSAPPMQRVQSRYPNAQVLESEQRVLMVEGLADVPRPAWRLLVRFVDRDGGQGTREVWVGSGDGAILHDKPWGFEATGVGQVFRENPLVAPAERMDLEYLDGSGYLRGRGIDVLAPGESDPRTKRSDFMFVFDPDSEGDASAFDEVQGYYFLTAAIEWFKSLGAGDDPNILLRVRAVIDGRGDNARYIPLARPEVLIGRGEDGSLQGLARDVDVVLHELSHHYIYRRIKSSQGESGILHEGTADYFAYAYSGDPFLAESVHPREPYLRTADLPAGLRYDRASYTARVHELGQYWSAVLWDLHQSIGAEEFAQAVFRSIDLMPEDAGFSDAFLALVTVDRMLAESSEPDGMGPNYCTILTAGVDWGFAAALRDFDGGPCGIDLQALGAESMDAIAERVSARDRAMTRDPEPPEVLGIPCGVVRGVQDRGVAGRGPGMGAWFLGLALFAALFLDPWVQANQRSQCRSRIKKSPFR